MSELQQNHRWRAPPEAHTQDGKDEGGKEKNGKKSAVEADRRVYVMHLYAAAASFSTCFNE